MTRVTRTGVSLGRVCKFISTTSQVVCTVADFVSKDRRFHLLITTGMYVRLSGLSRVPLIARRIVDLVVGRPPPPAFGEETTQRPLRPNPPPPSTARAIVDNWTS